MKKAVLCAALVLSAVSLGAPPAGAQPGCLQIGRIWSWKPLDRQTLIVEDEMHRKFKLQMMGYCPRLPLKLDLAFKSNGGTSGLDCVAKGDDVISQDVGSSFTCPVMSVVPYTAAMERADKAAAAAAKKRQGY
ncbi:MAG: DUF6491 family protein [Rhizomicrobium sp.]